MTVTTDDRAGRWRSIGSWALRILLALAFAGSGVFKLTGRPAVIDEFARVGFGQWLRYFTAVLELGGALLLVLPRTIVFGALILGGICVGAFFAQVFRLHINILHTIAFGAIFAGIAWAYRAQLISRPNR